MAKLRDRDWWHLTFCLAWLTFAILPLAPHLPGVSLMLLQLDAMEMKKFPPEIPYMGDPFYWEYRLSFLEVCRTFVWSDSAELISNLLDCKSYDGGYSFNATAQWLKDDVNATLGWQWPLNPNLNSVSFGKEFALYMIGFVCGLAGILTTILTLFTKWKVQIVDAVFKLTSLIFLVSSMALVQVYDNPSNNYLGLGYTSIASMLGLLSFSLFALKDEELVRV